MLATRVECWQLTGTQLNFATEFLAESALDTARALDRHFCETKTLIGPLHGVPISVKVRKTGLQGRSVVI